MKNRINSILNRMHDKNYKLKEMYSLIKKCQMSKESHYFRIETSWRETDRTGAKYSESAYFTPDTELKVRILNVMEEYYNECAEKYGKELEEMVEELKQL